MRVIEQRHADQLTYEQALADWRQSTANPEQHPQFTQAYANELRDVFIKLNRRRKVARELLEQLELAQWRLLVNRELQTDEWFMTSDEEASEPAKTPLS